ncbi:MAG: A/G-specific adenine glycosylase [Oligoflexia bacterium]|nr:A/G-specific adenine glycosylase [Oligoflexia bacterium]
MSVSESLQSLAWWFDRQKRVLPWRDRPTVYRVWISEIMLQQTQVATVVPYFERFLGRFPSVEALAEAPESEVLRLWAGLGYYSRARNLKRAAEAIVAEGRFPHDRAGWLELPGIGEYTAGAILSIALDQPEAILDGNVERVLSRVFRVERDALFKATLWKRSRSWVRAGARAGIRPGVLNQALMELGATLCARGRPRCEACPLARVCRARKAGRQAEYPSPKKPKAWILVREELHCVLDRRGRVLLRERRPGEWRAGLWDFLEARPPRGAVSLGLLESRHVVTRHKVSRLTHVWRVDRALKARSGTRWISLEEPEVALGSAARKVLRRVRDMFRP